MEHIIDENYYDLIIDNYAKDLYDITAITPINERHSLLHIMSSTDNPCDLGIYPYHSFPSIFTLTSDVSIDKSGISKVQANPSLGLYGEGVLIGVIDTGINYQHPAFLYPDHTSRIVSIWDQTINSGTPPQGFTYGSEYSREMINLALESESPLSIVPSTDEDGHGTAIASVITGSPSDTASFRGIVPDSEIIIVKLKEAKQKTRNIYFIPENAICFQESDVMLGLRYLVNLASSLQRPLAICLALGTSQGGHNGRGAASSYLSYIAQIPRIGVAIAAGNEGNHHRHHYGIIDSATYSHDFELKVGSEDTSFSMEIWSYAPARLSIELISPAGEMTPTVYPEFRECRKFDFIFEASVVWINNIIFEEETGEQMILIRLKTPLTGIWHFRVANIENVPTSFHAWLPSGTLISDETFFLDSSPDTTITSPGNAIFPLTVTAYNQLTDGILISSGRGYTRTNQIKPDIAAPGFEIPCASHGNSYATITGTGAAAAHAAGVMAMILEWAVINGNYTYITGNDINRLLIRGASRDPATTYPNNIWGYGKLDVFGLFEKLTT